MFFLAKVQYYNSFTEESLIEFTLLYAEDLEAATYKLVQSYTDTDGVGCIEYMTLVPAGDEGEGMLPLEEEDFTKLAKEWTGVIL